MKHVSRFLLLLLFLIWMAWRSDAAAPRAAHPLDLALFFGMYALVVVTLGMWSRLLARRIVTGRARRGRRYFGKVSFAAQLFIPAWLAVGTFFLGWGPTVQRILGPVGEMPVQVPGALIGTLPALLTWIALWWSQYPADRALRDQGLLVRLDQDLPISASPTLGEYVRQNLRLQILFTAAPIVLILALHDVIMVGLGRMLRMDLQGSAAEGMVTLFSAITVFVMSPILLARILGARPLPASDLRDRLQAMASLYRLRFRNILLWPTHHRIANALVMGVVPRFRYVLLSDLLLEEMTDEQIEAVFAHELGHVVHRHMIWYLVFMKVLVLALAVVALVLEAAQQRWMQLPAWMPVDLLMTLIGFGAFLLAFGYVSRRFERQADVFAARTLERHLAPLLGTAAPATTNLLAGSQPYDDSVQFPDAAEAAGDAPWQQISQMPQTGVARSPTAIAPANPATSATPAPAPTYPGHRSHVGPLGASIFASALERVALINNMPIGSPRRLEGSLIQRLGWFAEQFADLANNWLHGSISTRMRALQRMSTDPAHTHRFDQRMSRLYAGLLGALLITAALAWMIKLPV